MMMKFVLMLVGLPLIALSLVITITILKTGWNIVNKKEPHDFDTTESKIRHGGK
ncbi:hypothetical protein NGG16_02575 [Enterococcus casseliflavus]|uniref:hypothetical protein n=1 Tax=Enterococcus casseliflavus TaxID=37734 RepID=UPI002DBE6A80|nr:hypothetical protein [Enterococcus casseliflavus]MEB8416319.1 hypothetical protein [Enterococcus casseliflavus]